MTGHLFNLYLCLYIISSHLYVMLFCVSQLVFCAHCCAEVRQLYYPIPFPSSLPISKTPFQMDVSRTVVLKVGLDHRVRYRASYGANSDMTLDHFQVKVSIFNLSNQHPPKLVVVLLTTHKKCKAINFQPKFDYFLPLAFFALLITASKTLDFKIFFGIYKISKSAALSDECEKYFCTSAQLPETIQQIRDIFSSW